MAASAAPTAIGTTALVGFGFGASQLFTAKHRFV